MCSGSNCAGWNVTGSERCRLGRSGDHADKPHCLCGGQSFPTRTNLVLLHYTYTTQRQTRGVCYSLHGAGAAAGAEADAMRCDARGWEAWRLGGLETGSSVKPNVAAG